MIQQTVFLLIYFISTHNFSKTARSFQKLNFWMQIQINETNQNKRQTKVKKKKPTILASIQHTAHGSFLSLNFNTQLWANFKHIKKINQINQSRKDQYRPKETKNSCIAPIKSTLHLFEDLICTCNNSKL